jgi:general secretion pathway protein E
VLPVAETDTGLLLAITDPFDGALRESLGQLLQQPLDFVVSPKKDILAIIDRVFGFRSSVSAANESLGEGRKNEALAALVQLRTTAELSATTNDEHVISAVDYLLNYAFDQRASDIHLEPRGDTGVIRFRIDGILHDIETIPLGVHGAVTSRIKVLARMDIAERRRPQDGRIKTFRADREVELRV